METKVCTKCGELKDVEDFYNQLRRDGGRYKMAHCKECHKTRTAERLRDMSEEEREDYYEKMRARKMLSHFGMTLEDYEQRFANQGGVCALCGLPETALESNTRPGAEPKVKRLAVDHDHETGGVRGLLCFLCNTRIGYFEKHGLMPDLIHYLEAGAH